MVGARGGVRRVHARALVCRRALTPGGTQNGTRLSEGERRKKKRDATSSTHFRFAAHRVSRHAHTHTPMPDATAIPIPDSAPVGAAHK